jgi:hypothetical protein
MSVKTCLLCGKPLGRIRPGSGGDFCSREHRTQYRLRRSMDCLTEANKVATLARRRETPKPLFSAALAGRFSASPRAFLDCPPITRQAILSLRWSGLVREAGFTRADSLQLAKPDASRGQAKREFPFRLAPPGAPLAPRIPAPPLEARRQAMRTERTLHIASGSVQGNAFRVSARAGFHPPELKTRREIDRPRRGLQLTASGPRAFPLRQPQSIAVNRAGAAPLPLPKMTAPAGPARSAARMNWPEAFPMQAGACAGMPGPRPASRFFKADWTMAIPKTRVEPRTSSFSTRRITRLARLPQAAREAPLRGRLTFGEFGFTGATEEARLNWAGSMNGKAPVLEYKL